MNASAVHAYLDELLDPAPQPAAAPPLREAISVMPVMPMPAPFARDAAEGSEAARTTSSQSALRDEAPVIPIAPASARGDFARTRPAVSADAAEMVDVPARVPADRCRWLRLRVGQDRYAFALLRVQEVVRPTPIVALRGAPPALLGAMNLRGRIVPVYDLGRWLGGAGVVACEQARIVVVTHGDALFGVLVSAVEDVATIDAAQIEPAPSAARAGTLLGITRIAGMPVVLLDADALFD